MNFQKTSKLWFDPEGNEPHGKNRIRFSILLRCSGKNNKVDAVDKNKNSSCLDKKSKRKGTVRKKLHIISKNFYFILLCEQFFLNIFNCDRYFNHLKSKRIPPPINLLLGKQSSNSTIFALKII